MIAAVYTVYILNCFFLIMVVLLQAGKGDGMGAVFGGGGSNTLLGNRGTATFLSKLTVGSAVLFMVLSIVIAFHSSDPGSVMDARPVDPNESPAITGVGDETEEEEPPLGQDDDEGEDETDEGTDEEADDSADPSEEASTDEEVDEPSPVDDAPEETEAESPPTEESPAEDPGDEER